MYRVSFVAGLATAIVLFNRTTAEGPKGKSTLIPLDRVWAYEMPGTRDVRELEPKLDVRDPAFKELYLRSRVYQIADYLSSYVPKEGEWAEPAFVVVGTGKEALKNAHAVFKPREIKEQVRQLPKDTELSLVFYSYVTGWHPQVKSIEQSPDLITVKYQFIAPEEPSFGAKRFALIPIGKLAEGNVRVDIEQISPVDYKGRPVAPKRNAERFICNSFSFDVR